MTALLLTPLVVLGSFGISLYYLSKLIRYGERIRLINQAKKVQIN
jgi:hypothetical protein